MTTLETLWHDYRYEIAGYIGKQLRDRDTTDDLVSTVYLRALVAIRNGNGATSNARGWLYQIARSVINDHWRGFRHTTMVEWDALTDRAEDAPTPHERAAQSILCSRVRHAVRHLVASQSDTVTLRMQGYAFAEIGDMLGVSGAAAKQLNTRAYRTLREQLAGVYEAEAA